MMCKALRLSLGYFLRTRALQSRRIHIALLLTIVSAVYANALGASFQFDDFNVIVDYSAVHSLRAWFDALPSIRPLLKLSYTLNWMLATGPFGFHLFNLACHLANAVLVFYLSRSLLSESARADAIALLATLLFAVHPAQTEAVTYISGRSMALMATFYLGGLCAAMSERSSVRAWLAPLLLIAALLIKETAWSLPFAALLLYRLRSATWRDSLLRTRALWIALFGAMLMIISIPAYRRMLGHVLSIRSTFDNIALQVDGWGYLLMRPTLLRTNIDPDLPLAPMLDVVWWLKAAALGLGFIYAWRTPSRWMQFAFLWFFLHLLPTNSLLPRNDIANDRQLYLALFGPALVLARALFAVRINGWRIALPIVLIVFCGAATALRNRDYRDEISLWQATAQASPHKARVWNNLGYAYQLAGRNADARAAYARALALNPEYERARINWRLLRAADGATYP